MKKMTFLVFLFTVLLSGNYALAFMGTSCNIPDFFEEGKIYWVVFYPADDGKDGGIGGKVLKIDKKSCWVKVERIFRGKSAGIYWFDFNKALYMTEINMDKINK